MIRYQNVAYIGSVDTLAISLSTFTVVSIFGLRRRLYWFTLNIDWFPHDILKVYKENISYVFGVTPALSWCHSCLFDARLV